MSTSEEKAEKNSRLHPEDISSPVGKKRKRLFDIRGVLSEVYRGPAVMKLMDKNKMATIKERRVIVPALVSHIMERFSNKPSADIKAALAREFIDEFPYLRDPNGITGHELWYIKGVTGRPASGYFESHLRYIRPLMNLKTAAPGPNREKKAKVDEKQKPKLPSLNEDNISEQEDQEEVAWLKHNTLPEGTVAAKMKRTSRRRYEWIRGDSRPSTRDILDKYPRLLDAGMVELDFEGSIEASHDALFSTWPNFADAIIKYAEKIHTKYQETLQLEVQEEEKLTQSEKENLAFSILPLILTSRAPGKRGKCSATSSLKSFIDAKPEGTDIGFYACQLDMPQPFIVVLGSRIDPLQVFVMVERRAVEFNTLTKAVDYCFKLIYVLDVEYQTTCSAVWEFFQRAIYNVPGSRNTCASVRELRTFICREVL